MTAANVLRREEITVTRIFPSGAIELAAVVDGQRIHRTYFGTPKREAIANFRRLLDPPFNQSCEEFAVGRPAEAR